MHIQGKATQFFSILLEKYLKYMRKESKGMNILRHHKPFK
jgi:hypothetical protein